jgi:hypothetical protein
MRDLISVDAQRPQLEGEPKDAVLSIDEETVE